MSKKSKIIFCVSLLTLKQLMEEYEDKLEVAKIILDNVITMQKKYDIIRIIVPNNIVRELLSIVKGENFVASKFSENYGFESGKIYEFKPLHNNVLNHADSDYTNIEVPICSIGSYESV